MYNTNANYRVCQIWFDYDGLLGMRLYSYGNVFDITENLKLKTKIFHKHTNTLSIPN